MIYSITAQKDTTIFERSSSMNAGIDEILEITTVGELALWKVKFKGNTISDQDFKISEDAVKEIDSFSFSNLSALNFPTTPIITIKSIIIFYSLINIKIRKNNKFCI